ncbi:MAG: FAD-dependent oxidoreductase [Clostridia bacterium]|jgi:hypothetical protein|nr:FAD-dependent oxidoreductase [Clostridia bacterium]
MIEQEVFDLVVAGGGPAGIGAAVAAARNGTRVLLIEKAGYLGGMATDALVPAFCPYSNGEEVVIGGIGLEILEAMKKEGYESPFYDYKPDRMKAFDWVPIDSEILKRVLDEIVIDSGCQVLLHTHVTDITCQDGFVESITVHSKEGSRLIKAKYFADCTGDADLVAMAGGAYEYGDKNGLVQAGTLCFKVANFDTERFMKYANEVGEDGNLNVASKKAKEAGEFLEGEKNVAGIALQADGVAGFNFGHVYDFYPLRASDLTRAEIEARSKIPEMIKFLRKYVPGAEKAVLVTSGPHIGLRESRRIVGEYQLTKQDYNNRMQFEDTIARYAYPIDRHAAKLEEVDHDSDDREYVASKYKNGEYYTIPFRALLPKTIKNLIVAGRTISSDRAMMGSVRVMPACFATGQAAGTAAAICTKNNQEFREINIKSLQENLRKQGSIV